MIVEITLMIVDAPSQYNIILGRPAIYAFEAVISIAQMRMKYPVEDRYGKVMGVGVV